MVFLGKVIQTRLFSKLSCQELQIPSHFVFPKLIIGLDKEMKFIDGETFVLKKACVSFSASASHYPLRRLNL